MNRRVASLPLAPLFNWLTPSGPAAVPRIDRVIDGSDGQDSRWLSGIQDLSSQGLVNEQWLQFFLLLRAVVLVSQHLASSEVDNKLWQDKPLKDGKRADPQDRNLQGRYPIGS